MHKKIFFKLNYVSNTKIKFLFVRGRTNITNTLFSKRLFFFILLFFYFQNNSNFYFSGIRFLRKYNRNQKFNILRAPYKNKLAQNSYVFRRYFFTIIIVFFINERTFNNQSISSFISLFSKPWLELLSTNIYKIKSINYEIDGIYNYIK